MGKKKRKLSAAEKAAKRKRREEFRTVMINGKQKRIRRPPMIEGLTVDEFIRRNADPVWLHEAGMWEYLEEAPRRPSPPSRPPALRPDDDEDDLPF
jgi:16S rRNA U516 pseudouridylate synthase RsuA-like enzyme